MISLLLAAAAVVAPNAGPGIRHAPGREDWPYLLQIYDHRGRIVRQLHCDYRAPLVGTDPLPGLVRNRAFMAIVLAKDGAVEPWDLEPAWPTCKFLKIPQ